MRWDLEVIKGLVPVCRECRAANGDEPDKCGKLAWCKRIFSAGAAHEREECARAVEEVARLVPMPEQECCSANLDCAAHDIRARAKA